MKKRMFWLRELLCDADVAAEMGVANYAESLLRLTQIPKRPPIDQLANSRLLTVPMHSHGQSLESRVEWILDLSTSVSNPSRIIRFAISSCLVVALVGLTAIKIVPASSPAPETIANSPIQSNQDSEENAKKDGLEFLGVVKTSEGKTVANAKIYVTWNNRSNRLPRETLTTTTDDDGRYSLPIDVPGPYRIWAEGDGLTSLKQFLRGTRIVTKEGQTGPVTTDITVEKACDYNVSVVSAETQEGIEGAKVQFVGPQIEREYTTGMDGVAAIRGLVSKDWHFIVKAEGYATFFKKTAAQNIGTTTDLKFELKPGASIGVNLRDQYDSPVAEVSVSIWNEEISLPIYDSKTDEDGKLLIKGLPLKTKLEIRHHKDGYQFRQEKLEIANVEDIKEMKFIGKKFPYGGDAEFEITDEDGEPIAGARLKNLGSASANYRSATTDMGGRARLDNLYPFFENKYVIIESAGKIPQRIDIKPGPKGKPKLFRVALKTGKTLRGILLTPEGKPARVQRVHFNEAGTYRWDRGTVITNSNGKFEITGLPDSTTLYINTPRQYEPIGFLDVDVVEGKEIEIKMKHGAELRVRAVDEATGDPIPEFNVRLDRCEASPASDWRNGGIFASDTNPGVNVHGTKKEYKRDNLRAGKFYKVIVSAKGYQTKTIERMQTVLQSDSKLVDVQLTKE